jgi:hypothetical protein
MIKNKSELDVSSSPSIFKLLTHFGGHLNVWRSHKNVVNLMNIKHEKQGEL